MFKIASNSVDSFKIWILLALQLEHSLLLTQYWKIFKALQHTEEKTLLNVQ
jgi:hypothetical protein